MLHERPFPISSHDPHFVPDKPVTINGHLYVPATGELAQVAAAAINECERLRKRVDELLTANTSTLLENRELKRAIEAQANGYVISFGAERACA